MKSLSTYFNTILLTSVLLLTSWIIIAHTKKLEVAVCRNCNVIIIDINVLRYDALDCDNHPEKTPSICSFAKQSIEFTKNNSQSDLTRPSYISGLTSLYPSSHNMWNELYSTLDERIITLPSYLASKGYSTFFVGPSKGHSQIILDGFGQAEHVDSHLEREVNYREVVGNLVKKDKPFFLYLFIEDLHFPYFPFSNIEITNQYKPPGAPTTRQEYSGLVKDYLVNNYKEVFTQASIDENPDLFTEDIASKKEDLYRLFTEYDLDRRKSTYYLKEAWKPSYYAFLNFIDQTDSNDILYLKNNYLTVLRHIDTQLGAFFDLIEELKLDRTIIILRSNHGEEFFEHGGFSHQNNLYQELIHTPLLIKFPGVRPQKINQFTQDIDVMPTTLGLVGLDIPDQVQGKSLVALIKNRYVPINNFQIAQKGGENHISTFRKGDWKLIMKESQSIELYNLKTDPNEKINRVIKEEQTARRLADEYNSIIDKLPVYGGLEPPIPEWIDEEKLQRLKDEGYF